MIASEVRSGLDVAIQAASKNVSGTVIDLARFTKNLVYPICEDE